MMVMETMKMKMTKKKNGVREAHGVEEMIDPREHLRTEMMMMKNTEGSEHECAHAAQRNVEE